MNPFLSVWLSPKQTARYVIEYKTLLYSLLLVYLAMFASGITAFQNTGTYPDVPYIGIILVSFLGAPIVGYILYIIMAGMTLLIGKLLKGTGTFKELIQGMPVAYIPSIALFPINLLWILISPESFFLEDSTSAISIIFVLLSAVLAIWSLVINVAVVSEIHQFSIWRSLITLIIPGFILFLFFMLIFVVIFVAIIGTMGLGL